ncbi:MAG: F0F1 ATP synthase subunit A [Nitrospira sp.]|nr:F0F1 ATP synthase subunit A [Nitrospira sp.]MCP9462767.1 F0F1 ATP synthase subunit A [Nitrospira sp.]
MPIRTIIEIGPFRLTETVTMTWLIMAVLVGFAWFLSRRLSQEPGLLQVAVEGIIGAIDHTVRSVIPVHADRVFPLIATLWIFLAVANLAGIVPGLHSPTADLSATAALAMLVFLSVPWFGVRIEGLKGYLRHYLRPTPVMLPFHLISEFTRTVALAMRLFGNVMSLEMALVLVLVVTGFLVPIPLLALHIIEGLLQAFIFGMLALIYIGSAIQTQEHRRQSQHKEAA